MKIKTLSVSEVNNYIKKILDNDFILNNLSVKGEISNLKHHSSGHIYFSLKDKNSKINCVMFRSNAENLDFILKEGMEVIINGRVSVYTVAGSFQLYCDDIQKQGIGDLYHRFNQLKERLSREGYFDIEHKKSLPSNPQRIGIVTSPTGAAIEDIKNVIRRRNSKLDIVLYPALVQGKDAYKTIIKGIKYFNKKQSVDVIIIGRGGGSIEELWNFNEEELALEIFNSRIPIISAVGHEVDFTISDFISDVRAATPSQAAEIVTPLESDLFRDIVIIREKLDNIIEDRLNFQKSNLSNYSRILELNSPMNKVLNGYLEVDAIKDRLNYIIKNRVEKEKEKLFSLNNILQAKNPINILGRGYAIIKGEKSILKSKEDFKENENIEIVLHDGSVKGMFTLSEGGGSL